MRGFSFVLEMRFLSLTSFIVFHANNDFIFSTKFLILLIPPWQYSRVFTNGPGDLGSIPGRVIPKTFKIALDTSLLNTQQYKVSINLKWSNPGKGISPYPTPRCCSYWKGSLLVALDHGSTLYLRIILYIYLIAWIFIFDHWFHAVFIRQWLY